ncbi:MAG: undecaprenyl-diphosphatase UppP [Nitrospirota bacterium]
MGIIQGITEFIPVSSSAHLILVPWIFGWKGGLIDSLTFDVALHIGTLLAVFTYFWGEWKAEIIDFNKRLLLFVLVGTIPAGVIGVLFEDIIKESLRDPLKIAIALVIIGIVMLLGDRYSKKKKGIRDITVFDSIIIGFAQSLALIPGVSRSGITIVAGLFLGHKREDAAKFSFLLAIPVIMGAGLLELRHLFQEPREDEMMLLLSGIATSYIVGYLCIRFLIRYLQNHPLNVFVYYRILLAGVIMGFALFT